MSKEEVKQEGDFKIKKKPGRPRKLNKKDETIKVDLSKKEEEKKEDAVQEQTTDEVLVRDESPISEEVSKENVKETTDEPTEEKKEVVSPIQEITEEEVVEEKVIKEEPVAEVKQPEVNLPENVEKLVKFMEETGGTVEDYVRLNADYSNVDSDTLLKEFYKQTKPHLDMEEINFLLEDNFSYDEDMDEERDIRKCKSQKLFRGNKE
jgi:hypothetical protein